MQLRFHDSKTQQSVSTQDTSRKSSANSWLEMMGNSDCQDHEPKLLRFHTKSGKKFSSRVTYFSVMLKGDIIKFTNLVFGKGKSTKSRLQTLSLSKFSKIQYLVDILGFCSSEEWNTKQTAEEKEQNPSAHPKMNY